MNFTTENLALQGGDGIYFGFWTRDNGLLGEFWPLIAIITDVSPNRWWEPVICW
jgi:hypothetical protein